MVITYIEGIAPDSVLDEVRQRVKRIQIDGVLESAFIEEFIEDQPFSPFPQIQNTERPDAVCASLLEGKVAILVDNTPFVLIVPMTFWTGLQAAEDYYERSIYTTFVRWIRLILINISLFLPSLYVAITTFHPKLIPTNLLISIAAAREGIPFPAVIEALMMEFLFEGLREAGVRLPKPVGSAVSIVGALVIGQAAVQAGIISAPLVIVVATTGIASFAFPRYNLGTAYRMLRFPMLLLAGMLGLYGVAISTLAILIHLTNIRSFGIPYLSPVAPQTPRDLKDVFLRTPRWNMTHRPIMVSGEEKVRFPGGQKPDEKREGNRMSLHKALCMILVISLCFLTGCWDRTELNDLAIELGWGLDQAKNNKIEISAQFIIPSKMGMGQSGRSNAGKAFFTESGTGRDTHEAIQMMQTKMSREIFRGHQRVILIGEKWLKVVLLQF